MAEKQLAQKEKDLLVTYYLNKMNRYLKPFSIPLGKFFKGEVSIDSALPFRNVLDLGVEISDVTQRIYPVLTTRLETLGSSDIGIKEAIYYFESIIPAIKIDGKPLQEIIDKTGYKLKLIENPVLRVVSSSLFTKLTVQRDWLGDVIKGVQGQVFETLPFGCAYLEDVVTRKELALTTDNRNYERWVVRKGVRLFGVRVKKQLDYAFFAHELAGVKDAKWFEWVWEFENILLPFVLSDLSFAFSQMYKELTPLTVEELLELANKENALLLDLLEVLSEE